MHPSWWKKQDQRNYRFRHRSEAINHGLPMWWNRRSNTWARDDYRHDVDLSLRLWITSSRVVDCGSTIVTSSTIDVRLMIKASRCDGIIFRKYMSAWSTYVGGQLRLRANYDERTRLSPCAKKSNYQNWSCSLRGSMIDHIYIYIACHMATRSYIHDIDFAPTGKRDWYIFWSIVQHAYVILFYIDTLAKCRRDNGYLSLPSCLSWRG
jgi:hypothetical protein